MISHILKVFLLAMTPIGELRAAIPVGLAVYKLNWLAIYCVAVVGNLIPIIALLLFLEPIANWLSKHFKMCDKFFNWLYKHTNAKMPKERVAKYKWWALTLFVAVPLPITGAWTGSVIAFLYKIPFKKAFLAIATGVAIAGVIVLSATIGGIAIERYFGWQTLIGVIILAIIVWRIYHKLSYA